MKSLFDRIPEDSKAKELVKSLSAKSKTHLLSARRDIFMEINQLEGLMNLSEELTPTNRYSLYYPEEWAKDFHSILLDLIKWFQRYNTQVKIHNSLFPDNKVDLINEKRAWRYLWSNSGRKREKLGKKNMPPQILIDEVIYRFPHTLV